MRSKTKTLLNWCTDVMVSFYSVITLKIKTIPIKISSTACLILISQLLLAQDKTDFSFRDDNTFKIVQFTDIHWKTRESGNKATKTMMNNVLNKENPDLVVFTGDIVISENTPTSIIKKSWREITKLIANRKIRWVATLGNHDSEGEFPRDSLVSFITSLPFCANWSSAEEVTGVSDFYLGIKDKTKIAALLYFLDSGEYAGTFEPGKYAWISPKQIQWYKNVSNQMRQENNGQTLPSLAFFHIPLPEYNNVVLSEPAVGNKGESISSPVINTGLFSAFIQQKDVMGTFVGHDHNNDFIGEHHDIALAYGRRSGNNSYGKLPIGARVIQLYANSFRFNTWISTTTEKSNFFKYPSWEPDSISKKDFEAPCLPAKRLWNGVYFRYKEGKVDQTTQIHKLKTIKNGTLPNFSLSPAKAKDHFAFEFESYIQIPEDGLYNFFVKSDDGCVLFINEKKVVDNDGGHSPRMRNGQIGLMRGLHRIKVLYFEDYMGEFLEIGISSTKIKKGPINSNMLFTDK